MERLKLDLKNPFSSLAKFFFANLGSSLSTALILGRAKAFCKILGEASLMRKFGVPLKPFERIVIRAIVKQDLKSVPRCRRKAKKTFKKIPFNGIIWFILPIRPAQIVRKLGSVTKLTVQGTTDITMFAVSPNIPPGKVYMSRPK